MIALSPVNTATALAAGLLLLAACASEPAGSGAGVLGSGGALPPPNPGEPAAVGGQAVAPVQPVAPPLPEPSSTSQPPTETTETDGPVIVKGPDGTTWHAPTRRDKGIYRADIEDCYHYAEAQTQRDAQYLNDRNAGIDTLTNRSPYAGLRQRVDEFELRNQRASLMSSCMESKGYARADTVLPRLEF